MFEPVNEEKSCRTFRHSGRLSFGFYNKYYSRKPMPAQLAFAQNPHFSRYAQPAAPAAPLSAGQCSAEAISSTIGAK